jgi:hypothetical protein
MTHTLRASILFVFFVTVFASSALSSSARADDDLGEAAPPEASTAASTPASLPERDRSMEYFRFEGTIGFLGGWSRYADSGLSGPLPADAFERGAGAGAPIAGLRYDARLVVAFARMTVGVDLAWSLFRAQDTTRTVVLDDGASTVSDRAAFLWALRFGLGLELSASEDVRLFADVIGSVRFLEVQSTLETTNVTSNSVSFAPGLRVGARVRIHDAFFVQLAADGSPFGPWLAGDLSVGGAIE